MQALELKAAGNEFFSKGEHAKAVESFSEAISLDPANHVLYSNRAASYTVLRELPKALADAEKTIELNHSFTKVFYLYSNSISQLRPRRPLLESDYTVPFVLRVTLGRQFHCIICNVLTRRRRLIGT